MRAFFLLLFAATALAQQIQPSGDTAGAHDPSIIKQGDTYYVFTTGKSSANGQLPIRCSQDLQQWRFCGQLFPTLPPWIAQHSPKTQDLWAPDISFSHGLYRLYYSYSVFGRNTSGIALATNKTLDQKSPDYAWKDEGLILESVATDAFNAIDPNYAEDAQGGAWLAFGSFWSGIKMRALDPATGRLSTRDTTLYSLAARAKSASTAKTAAPDAATNLPADSEAIEAPFLFHHDGFYYLFVAWDLCCRGTHSTYRTMVGRAKRITGPYLDRAGQPMLDGAATQLLFPTAQWLGPGGASIQHDNKGDLIVFHAYDAVTGKPSLQLSRVNWKEGWPTAIVP